MTKRPSLFASKAEANAPLDVEAKRPPIAKREPVEAAPISKLSTSPQKRPPSREGKRVLSIYLKPEAWKQLRMLSLDTEQPTQALGEEAINLLFEKHRLNRIA